MPITVPQTVGIDFISCFVGLLSARLCFTAPAQYWLNVLIYEGSCHYSTVDVY